MPATISLYDIGDVATLTAAFTNLAGAPTNPTAVTVTVTAPDGTVTTPTAVNDSAGNYHVDVPATQVGDWFYKFAGTGAVAAAEEGTFTVRPSGKVSPTALTSLHSAREYVLRDATDGSQDRMLRMLINAYSRAIYSYTRREWLPLTTAAARRFTYTGGGFLSLEPYELRTLTSITMYTDMPTTSQRVLVAGTSTIQGEFRLHPPNRTDEGTFQWITMPQAAYGVSSWGTPAYYNNPYPYGPVGRSTPLDFEITVLGDWGIGTVPEDVELALLVAIKDAYENPSGYSSGTEGGLSFTEEQEFTTGSEARARNLPIESRALLTLYKRGSQVVTA